MPRNLIPIHITIYIPAPLERLALSILLAWRRLRFGCPFRRIPLTQGKFADVDPDVYPRIAKSKWRLCKTKGKSTPYAERSIRLPAGRYSRILMHRQILNLCQKPNPPRTPVANLVIDHINRNGLDNRKANLRLATVAQNAWNSRKRKSRSRFKGVCFIKQKRKFRACIWANRKRIHLGYFQNETDAAKAYDHAAKKLHGYFASLNFPRPR